MKLDKDHCRKKISDIMYVPKNKVPPLRKYNLSKKKGTEIHYEVSDATNIDHSHGDIETESNEDKEKSSNNKK